MILLVFYLCLLQPFLALYVIRTINRQEDINKVERDLLIGYFNKLNLNLMPKYSQLIYQGVLKGQYLQIYLKNMKCIYKNWVDLAKSHNSKYEKNLTNLDTNIGEIRELLTAIPEREVKEKEVLVKDGKDILLS